jgi:hypothetical protein
MTTNWYLYLEFIYLIITFWCQIGLGNTGTTFHNLQWLCFWSGNLQRYRTFLNVSWPFLSFSGLKKVTNSRKRSWKRPGKLNGCNAEQPETPRKVRAGTQQRLVAKSGKCPRNTHVHASKTKGSLYLWIFYLFFW